MILVTSLGGHGCSGAKVPSGESRGTAAAWGTLGAPRMASGDPGAFGVEGRRGVGRGGVEDMGERPPDGN